MSAAIPHEEDMAASKSAFIMEPILRRLLRLIGDRMNALISASQCLKRLTRLVWRLSR